MEGVRILPYSGWEAIEIIRQSSDMIIFGSEEDPDSPTLDN